MNDMFINLQQQASDGGGLLTLVPILGLVIGIITFYVGHRLSKKKFRQELTLKCIDRYQQIVKEDKLNYARTSTYLGFMNEELYYIQHGLVDRKMGKEWLANMINYLPILVDKGGEKVAINEKLLVATRSLFAIESHRDQLFAYTRIRRAIYLRGNEQDYEYEFNKDLSIGYNHLANNLIFRHKVVCQMLLNLESDCYFRYIYCRICSKISHYIYKKSIYIRYGKSNSQNKNGDKKREEENASHN